MLKYFTIDCFVKNPWNSKWLLRTIWSNVLILINQIYYQIYYVIYI